MRKAYFTNKKIKKLNEFLNNGYLIATDNQLVWGVKGFISSDGKLSVREIKGQFLGGGIWDIYGYKVKIENKEFYCRNFMYALRSIYGYLVKKGMITEK